MRPPGVRRLAAARRERNAPVGELASTGVPVAPPLDRDAGAFFDVDNTMLRGASLFYIARGLHARRLVSRREILTAAWSQLVFRWRGVEDPAQMEKVREKALSFIAGRQVSELLDVAEEVFDEVMAAKIWPGTRDLAHRHLDRGQRVWLVTAAPVEIARVLARRLGLTGALGTVAETADGRYTGRLSGELLHGATKAEAVRLLAEAEGLDLARCAAYSDSSNDVPMLSLVGRPCAINPDRTLRAHAKVNDWGIRDFRRGRRATRFGLVLATIGGAASGTAAAVGRRRSRRRFLPRN